MTYFGKIASKNKLYVNCETSSFTFFNVQKSNKLKSSQALLVEGLSLHNDFYVKPYGFDALVEFYISTAINPNEKYMVVNDPKLGLCLMVESLNTKHFHCFRDVKIEKSQTYLSFLENIGLALKSLHSKGVKHSGVGEILSIGPESIVCSCDSWAEFLNNGYVEQLELLSARDQNLADAIDTVLDMHFFHHYPFDSSLLHGDLNPYNIFYNQNKIVFIDYGDALFGDPLFDVANFLSFFKMHEFFEEFVGYCGVSSVNEKQVIILYLLRILLAKTCQAILNEDSGAYDASVSKIRFWLSKALLD